MNSLKYTLRQLLKILSRLNNKQRLMKKFTLLFVFSLILQSIILAQFGALQGKVIDKETKEPIPFANIIIDDNGTQVGGTTSDFDGNYSIKSIPPGRYDIKVTYIGYKTVITQGVPFAADKIRFHDIEMTSTSEMLEEFEVTDYYVPIISKDYTSSGASVTSEEIAKMPNRNAGTVATTVGGVFLQDGERGIVRGGRGNGTATYIDGIRVIGSANVPQSSIEQVNVVLGGVPAQFDNTISGDINKLNQSKSPDSQEVKQLEVEEKEVEELGKLTATELNDFSKWDLWEDIRKNDLKAFQNLWKISPVSRYSVQVLSKDEMPVIDATVELMDADNIIIWSALTDNTGKAELWDNMFAKTKMKKLKLFVSYEDHSYEYKKPHLFENGINVLKIPVDCNTPDNIDIAFVVDATSSMGDEIEFLKTDLIDIVHHTKENLPGVSVNLGSVFYRCYGNSYATKISPLNSRIKKSVDFIKLQRAGEGGDEIVEEAFKLAVDSMKWSKSARARLLFFVMDQQPLTRADIIKKMQVYTQKAAEKGIRVIPIIASAESLYNAKSMEYLMRSIALATNGTTVFLTDHSAIGSTHAKPTTDEYDVELLNTLLKKIIYQFCFVRQCEEEIDAEDMSDTTYINISPVIAHEIVDANRKVVVHTPKPMLNDFTLDIVEDIILYDSVEDLILYDNEEDFLTVENNIKDSGIKFFPNPTTGRVTVNIEGEINELYLFDISGKLLSKYDLKHQSTIKIDLGQYSKGIYFLKFYENNKLHSGKIVLSR